MKPGVATPVIWFLLDWLVLGVAIASLLVVESWWIRVFASLVAALWIARLFVIGHDACHGSYTPNKTLNKWIGRIAFLPSLTPFSLWEIGHNLAHHGFTNLKGRDYVWTPLSPEEWALLDRRRRVLERIYRTPWGLGAYYLFEIWWKRLYFPGIGATIARRSHCIADNVLVTAFLGCELAGAWALAPGGAALAAAIAWAVVVPFLLWNQMMGFAIYCHHTHPDVRWFDTRAEWSFYEAPVCSTTHTSFPTGLGWLLHNIFEHTAHHVDTGIPFYELPEAQRQLETICGADIIRVEPFSPREFLRHMRQCQIYDYRRHCWMTFSEAGALADKLTV